MGWPQQIPMQTAGCSGKFTESAALGRWNALCEGMIVIAANGTGCMRADPFNTGDGVDAIFDQVAQEQAGVKRLANGRECEPVGMNVGKDQNFHNSTRGHLLTSC